MHFSKSLKYTIFASFIILQTAGLGASAHAQNESTGAIDILPATTAQEQGIAYDSENHTHPALKMTPDKSELVHLDTPAASIVIGNPNHLSILADSAQTLVLVPRAPGATHFAVLDKNGDVVMQRHVIVAAPKEKYLRIRRSCAGSDNDSCQGTSVFYCPDMCHEILLGSEDGSGSASAGSNAEILTGNTAPGPNGETQPPDTDTE